MGVKKSTELYASNIIFGAGLQRVNIAELSRRIGVHHNTVYGWRRHPYNMSLLAFGKIVRATKMTDEQIVRAVRGL